jgi:hypothetical protein
VVEALDGQRVRRSVMELDFGLKQDQASMIRGRAGSPSRPF